MRRVIGESERGAARAPGPFCLALAALAVSPSVGVAAEAGRFEVAPWTAAPFALFLLSIAVMPLIRERWWHANRNKALVAAAFAAPIVVYLLARHGDSAGESTHRLLEGLSEYAGFILLLLALYAISGGVLVTGDIPARPRTNTLFLGIGAVLANLIGTTGASMVLIRPVLKINHSRRRKLHLPIFFIFIVSNTGGLLTPLGDPPLFLGFLNGVDFFWTMRLWRQWLLVNGVLLAVFYVWDSLAYRRESVQALRHDAAVRHPMRFVGLGLNGPLLLGVLLTVVLHSESAGQLVGRAIGLGDLTLHQPWGEVVLLALTLFSTWRTRESIRRANQFVWGPIVEVATLFLGIFITMVPALALLQQHGAMLNVTTPARYFWLTGLLSAILDNAPTYLTFATLAAGARTLGELSVQQPDLLAAVSCGAVFMGALTYIGNGPNFMVKAIADEHGYKMPSFTGYAFYSLGILAPLYAVTTALFFI
jgi:Na+/H+ antiporter NhaD/arsenite permease-like protein